MYRISKLIKVENIYCKGLNLRTFFCAKSLFVCIVPYLSTFTVLFVQILIRATLLGIGIVIYSA